MLLPDGLTSHIEEESEQPFKIVSLSISDKKVKSANKSRDHPAKAFSTFSRF